MTFNAGIEAAALKWPNGCHDPDSCSRHKRCMYVQCRNLNRDIKDEIGEAVAEQNTRPSSSAPVEQREAVARIIDPQAFKMWHDLYHHCIKNGDDEAFAKRCADSSHKPDCDAALTKADAILSLPGSSRDEVLEKLHAFVVEHYANQDMNHMDFRVDAYVIAAALEQSKEK